MCTRVVYTSPDGKYVVTGRNMDWFQPALDISLWVLPRGLRHHGGAEENSLAWTSHYGSVALTSHDKGKVEGDGLNEKGLAVNRFYLAETDFGPRDIKRPGLSWAGYVQYLLDNFATVSQTVTAMCNSPIQVVAYPPIPGAKHKSPSMHFSLSDASGDSAIFEYLNGNLVIHHGKQYKVMTNSPIYAQQLALNTYWQSVGGDNMLPGTVRSADRYIRASYYVNNLPIPTSHNEAISNMVSVMNNVVQPPQATVNPAVPDVPSTIWQTFANNTRLVYYFNALNMPNRVWVDLKQLDFNKEAKPLMVPLYNVPHLAGNIKDKLRSSEPFTFTALTDT